MGRVMSWLQASKVIWLSEKKKKNPTGNEHRGRAGDRQKEGWKQRSNWVIVDF